VTGLFLSVPIVFGQVFEGRAPRFVDDFSFVFPPENVEVCDSPANDGFIGALPAPHRKQVFEVETPEFFRFSVGGREDLIHWHEVLMDGSRLFDGEVLFAERVNAMRKTVLHYIGDAFPVIGDHYGVGIAIPDKVKINVGAFGPLQVIGASDYLVGEGSRSNPPQWK
jgi:hypothetical protein